MCEPSQQELVHTPDDIKLFFKIPFKQEFISANQSKSRGYFKTWRTPKSWRTSQNFTHDQFKKYFWINCC